MCLTTVKGGTVGLKVVVQAKAKKTRIAGLHNDMLKLAVASPPVDGKANREVIAFLAELFGLKKKDISIVAGERSRKKICLIGNLGGEAIRRKLAPLVKI